MDYVLCEVKNKFENKRYVLINFRLQMVIPSILAAVWSKAEVWSRLFGGIAGSKPAEHIDVRLLFVV